MDLGKPFERLTMVDAVKKYANVDWNEVETLEQARAIAKEHNIAYEERHKKGDILNLFFEEYVEEHLLQPTFIMDHPIEISPLTKKKPENPEYVERFEFFMNGWEMANAYSELNDPIDQRERFKAQDDCWRSWRRGSKPHRRRLSERTGDRYAADRWYRIRYRPYVYAADRSQQAIRDVLLFPTMKSLGAAAAKKAEAKADGAEVLQRKQSRLRRLISPT